MLAMATFVGFVVLVIGLIHFYLWKRLVRDTTRPGRWRRVGAVAALLLALLVPATLAGTRNGWYWLAWPGYLWLALMFYLLVLLLVLEVPTAVVRLVMRRRARSATAEGPEPEPALVGTGNPPAAPASTGDAADGQPAADAAGARFTGDRPPAADTRGARPVDHADPGPPAADIRGARSVDHADPGPPAGVAAGHDPSRRLLLARGTAIFAGLTAAGITGYGVRTAMGPPRLDRVRIPLAKLPRSMDGLRIATVSDIHLGPLRGRAHTERIVAMINRLDADLVAVVGDLVDGTVAELGEAAAPLRDLRSRYGSFFVTGNHEYYSGVEEWVREVDRLGLRVLQNERQEIRARGGVLDLAGVNDVTAAGTGLAAPADYAAALGDRDPSRPVVLLAHQPVAAHEAATFGVDLQLSGHTHGGQMVPFNLAVKLQQPVVSGLGEVDGTKVYVTNGAGFWGPPVRVGAPPQVTLVELRAP
ncbi:metallophosphoesterase [Micromonospora sp. WMMD1128]|uniref:metallophosphoesterase n=1 Tax=Micromonospora sp. WMMD1128 TaxID=3015150 RepID=UPI00248BFD98|nr:metallophosphoesterase [Micromonospora sp. WMMD1128]WBB73742.1 metallophosphoesterase [Micromonospora sp. WMMD1128]